MEDEVTAIPLVPVTRPNGRVYRPRKIRFDYWFEADHRQTLVFLVLGTHDIDLARGITEREAAVHGVDDIRLVDTGWWRQSIRNFETYWAEDAVHGAAGVMFEEDF